MTITRLLVGHGRPVALQEDLARYSALTPKSVAEAGKKWLGAGRVVVEVRPEPSPAGDKADDRAA